MKRKTIFSLLCVFSIFCNSFCFGMTIDRVILSTDSNPDFIEFWPLVAKAWNKIGIRPTLALIADKSVVVDTSLGDVIRLDPIPGVSVILQAQAIRLLLPAYFPNDICLVADIDMYPLDKDYFLNTAKDAPDDAFVIYRDKGYPPSVPQYPMCYLAAKGSVFMELFSMRSVADIPILLQQWSRLNLGYVTDERVMYQCVQEWIKKGKPYVKLDRMGQERLDRCDWENGIKKLGTVHYIDSHMPRPYSKYKKSIDLMASTLK